jgi:hypothetical protein
MKYAGIGSRETPQDVLACMHDIANYLALRNAILRSGGADGADTAFEMGTVTATNFVEPEIYLPWPGFNGRISKYSSVCDVAMDIAESYHPAWHRLSQGAQKLMARNVYQVLGKDLDDPVDIIICYTKDGKAGGGTGQAIQIANDFNIPVWDYGLSLAQGKSLIEAQQNLIHFINNNF